MLQNHQPQPLQIISPHVVGDPFFPTVGQRRDRWVLERTLGSGGFGTVTLWKNEETEEEIAIKKCRLEGNMSQKNCKRWQIEVDIMKRLKHENVVAGLDVPPGLESLQDNLPLLAMEYCSGGDLRKVLNSPKNCCGVSEYEVRCLAYDISAAVEYLHSNRIIHRDLKPENIVLQPTGERTMYKLIDLGYAKELDQSSVCQSFVGTLQYLAPELYIGQKYTQTVDYWSFGTVIFEALTGTRPFLPNSPPLQWHNEVMKKSQDDICAYFGNDGTVKFTKKLLTPNHLTKTMQKYFEDWLRQMLRWDPKTRGGGMSNEKRQNCFLLLDRILSIKISNILYVEANQLISVPVSSQQTMQELQRLIEQQTNIPVNDQDILLASGLTPDYNKPASQCWSEPREEELLVFLFKKSETNLSARKDKQLPLAVQYIVREPKVMLAYSEQKKAWAQSVYFCQEQNRDFHRLIGSQQAVMLSLLRANSEFVRLKNQMSAEVGQMLARKDQFKESLELDMSKYEDQKSEGIRSEQMFSKWEKTADEIEQYDNLKGYANKLDQDASVLQTRIIELQKSPFARGKNYTHLADCEDKAKILYGELRQAGKGNHRNNVLLEHTQMVDAVTKCMVHRDKAVSEMMYHISKICQCRAQLNQLLPDIETCCQDINAACKQLVSHQKSRQHDIWNFLKIAVSILVV
ncbi:hypothetical protein LOTGIDRAFT_110348 [Lottia gigantea]|uniref:IkappaB kinase n=1 Tax=Lottia gigantea TaxID=225164 RepID=V4AIS1_LOTGI|nr:hypothetical protein LOTGIDRAFT_110348 [Lottia gigantea]ESP04014.1 hypothetical protein LOTGIDRAFT_110348 [Lottia gigantea]